MPTYVYKFVDTGETIEVQQAFTDDTLTAYVHPTTGESMPVKKVFQPIGVTFKGSGFYKTDSRGGAAKKSAASTDSSGESTSSGSDSGGSTESSGSGGSDSPATSGSGSTSTATPAPATKSSGTTSSTKNPGTKSSGTTSSSSGSSGS